MSSIVDKLRRFFLPPQHVVNHLKDVQDKQDQLQEDLREIKRNLDPIKELIEDIERVFEKKKRNV